MSRLALLLLLPAVALAGPPSLSVGPSAGEDLVDPRDEGALLPADRVASDRIVNGVDATLEEYPETGALIFDGTIDLGGFGGGPTRTVVCSSTLIAPDVVMLAAHCVDPAAMTFGFGTVSDETWYWSRQPDLSDLATPSGSGLPALPEDAIAAWDVVLHPEFDLNSVGLGLNLNYDIALMFLETPVLDVEHAWVVKAEEASQVAVGADVTFVGWGNQVQTEPSFFEPPPPGSVGIKQTGWAKIAEVAAYEFALDENEGTPRKCRGDSGGPTFMEMAGDTGPFMKRIVGVASHLNDSQDCAETNVADTRVDYYLEWIEQEMSSRCVEGQRTWCLEADEPDGIVYAPTWDEYNQGGCGCSSAPASSAAGLGGLGLIGLLGLRRRR